MQRRASARKRQRVPCEVLHRGRSLAALLCDVSAGGAFLQLDEDLEIGEELEIRFADAHFAPQRATARVVRRGLVSDLVAAFRDRGSGVAWIEAPPFARDGAGEQAQPIEVEIEIGVDERPAVAEPVAAGGLSGAMEPPPSEAAPAAPTEAAPPPERTLDVAPASLGAEVVVIDEGELCEIAALIAALGESPLRMRWGTQSDPARWTCLPRLVIASARVALNVPIDAAAQRRGVRGVAVCDSPSRVLRTQLLRQGYDLIVQRASHPATLRLFFGALLHRRREQRAERRRAFGAPARVWRGWHSSRGILLDVTSQGASLLLERAVPHGAWLRVRVPGAFTGERALALRAVVEHVRASGEGAVHGVRFVALRERERARLRRLIARLDGAGPVADPGRAASFSERQALPHAERRKRERRPYRQPILALDAGTGAVRDVLIGADLSLGGMRVEPHPGLRLGQRVRIALQSPSEAEPIAVLAEVARDEGQRGLALRFVEVAAHAASALARLLAREAEIERASQERSGESERLVLGRLLAEVPGGSR